VCLVLILVEKQPHTKSQRRGSHIVFISAQEAQRSQSNRSKNFTHFCGVHPSFAEAMAGEVGKVRECGDGGKIKKTSWYSNCTVMVLGCSVGAVLREIF